MTEAWKQWEGQVVNGKFHLGPYLGGSDYSAVFLTELSEPGLQKAAIKLIAVDPKNAELCLSRLMLAARLSQRNRRICRRNRRTGGAFAAASDNFGKESLEV